MSEYHDSSADTSGSSGSTGDNIWLSHGNAPKKPDSFFKESFDPSGGSGTPSFSVYIDYSNFAEGGDSHSFESALQSTSSLRYAHQREVSPTASNNGYQRSIAINNNTQGVNSVREPSKLKSQSTDTVDTDLLVELGENQTRPNTNTNALEGSEDANLLLRPLKHRPRIQDRDSSQSTTGSQFDTSSIRQSSNNVRLPNARSSSLYGDENPDKLHPSTSNLPLQTEANDVNTESLENERQSKPSMEEAMKLFKQEVVSRPPVRLLEPRSSQSQHRMVPNKRSENSLQSRVSDQASRLSQTRRARRGPRYPSLLSSILVPLPHPNNPPTRSAPENLPPIIPALRHISGSSGRYKSPSDTGDLAREEGGTKEPQEETHNKDKTLPLDSTLALHRDGHTDMQHIYRYREILHEADLEKEIFYAQFVEPPSLSVHSSKLGQLNHIFSIWRIVLLILTCVIVPPLFFVIALELRPCVPDKTLMHLIMNKKYRQGIFTGFLWDVSLRWFRRLCLLLGILEVLIIIAGVGVGFGVGLSRA
ncbi:LADA_0C10528g1_1 [Lachancea dasiensis]|uniref:LADA_0C10528g1_1 n=1 Tax=Lachancea dasiensis TaxID=1072105 RepID=A0A1G4J1C5_9SACH|nr:LADA_0C10528g1_1 [Lachancea dasiensis]